MARFKDVAYEAMSEEEYTEGDSVSDEEESKGCLARIDASPTFQYLAISMIILNVFSMACEADNPGLKEWDGIDNMFLAWFVVELTIRVTAHGKQFFTDEDDKWWNIFDFVIVAAGVLDQWVIGPALKSGVATPSDGQEANIGNMMMIMRTMRLFRILRALRLLRQFKELYLLVLGLAHSFTSVFWIMVMFMMTLLTFAIFLTSFVGQQAEVFEEPHFIADKFGTMRRSMVTLFIFCSCDDWSTPARMVNKVFPWMVLTWISYMLIANFTLFSMITGLMADKMKAARENQEEAEQQDATNRYHSIMEGLKKIFHQADLSGDYLLDNYEFRKVLTQPGVLAELQTCGISIKTNELDETFTILDLDGDGDLTWEEFSDGLYQLCNPVSSKDIMYLETCVMKLDNTLKEAGVEEPGFDLKLDSLHSRASLVQQRVIQMQTEMDEIYKIAGYSP